VCDDEEKLHMLTFQSVQEERRVRARNANALLTSLLTVLEHARPLVPRQTAQHVEISARPMKNARTRSAHCNALMERSFAMGNARTKTGVPTKTAQHAEMHANTGKHAARTRSAFRSASMEKSFATEFARRIPGVQTKIALNAATNAQRERHAARTRSAFRSASMEKSFAKVCARRVLGVRTKTAQNAEIPARVGRSASMGRANALPKSPCSATENASRRIMITAEVVGTVVGMGKNARKESARNNEKTSCTAQPSDLKEKVVSFVIPLLAYHKRSKNM
jgi:hypothetical protein